MQVRLAYGDTGLIFDAPDDALVLEAEATPVLPDEVAALRAALRRPLHGPPLADLARGKRQAVLIFPDVTRAMPSARVVPVVLEELAGAGFGPERVTLLSATGTHRANTPAALTRPKIASNSSSLTWKA